MHSRLLNPVLYQAADSGRAVQSGILLRSISLYKTRVRPSRVPRYYGKPGTGATLSPLGALRDMSKAAPFFSLRNAEDSFFDD